MMSATVVTIAQAGGQRQRATRMLAWYLFACSAVIVAAVASGCAAAQPPPTPVWPKLLHATLVQNRSGSLALTELYYDWQGGRNLNVITSQAGGPGAVLFDNERANGR